MIVLKGEDLFDWRKTYPLEDRHIIAFCGWADCQCSLSDPAGPCEQYEEAFHPLGRCARCGWQHNYDD